MSRSASSPLIGLVCSVPQEGNYLIRLMEQKRSILLRTLKIYDAVLGGSRVVLAFSGIGKTNAAHAVTSVLDLFHPMMIINFGIGGAYPASGLCIGDIAVATREIYGDEGIEMRSGFHGLDHIGIPLLQLGRKKFYNEIPLDKNLTAKAFSVLKTKEKHAPEKKKGFTVRKGPFVTVSTCTGTLKRAKEREKQHRAICESMEGAAIAHVCSLYRKPLLEVRGISNIVEDRDRDKWDIQRASRNCQLAVTRIISAVAKQT